MPIQENGSKLSRTVAVTISPMPKITTSLLRTALLLLAALALSACTPKYDWREVRGTGPNAPFVVMLPAKPATFSRPINLDGMSLTMTMTAAEVGQSTFAVGSAELADASQADRALLAMKTALVKNINGTITREKALATAQAAPVTTFKAIEIDAIGPAENNGRPPLRLYARFVTQDKRIYQVIVLGRDKSIPQEALDTFFTSFKPQ